MTDISPDERLTKALMDQDENAMLEALNSRAKVSTDLLDYLVVRDDTWHNYMLLAVADYGSRNQPDMEIPLPVLNKIMRLEDLLPSWQFEAPSHGIVALGNAIQLLQQLGSMSNDTGRNVSMRLFQRNPNLPADDTRIALSIPMRHHASYDFLLKRSQEQGRTLGDALLEAAVAVSLHKDGSSYYLSHLLVAPNFAPSIPALQKALAQCDTEAQAIHPIPHPVTLQNTHPELHDYLTAHPEKMEELNARLSDDEKYTDTPLRMDMRRTFRALNTYLNTHPDVAARLSAPTSLDDVPITTFLRIAPDSKHSPDTAAAILIAKLKPLYNAEREPLTGKEPDQNIQRAWHEATRLFEQWSTPSLLATRASKEAATGRMREILKETLVSLAEEGYPPHPLMQDFAEKQKLQLMPTREKPNTPMTR